MRASEFVVEKKKRKRRPRWAAYGPGPYGGYGYDTGYSGDGGGDGGGVGEDAMRGVIYTKPDLENEWLEANRYPEFQKLGKDQWIKISRQGSVAKWSSLKDVGNVDNDLSNLEPEKRKRAAVLVNRGKVELPIVGRWPDGYLDLIAGNTRIATLLDQGHDPKVWVVDVPDVDIKENFADGTELPGDFNLMGQNLFLKNLAHNIKQRYPNATVKLSSDRVTAHHNEEDDEALNVMGTEVMDSGYIGVGLDDAFTESFQGVLVPTIKQTTEQLLAANPGMQPALFLGTDNWNPDAWAHIAAKLGYRLVAGDEELDENFADGRNPQDKGDSKRHGINTKASVSSLRKTAKQGGRKGQLAHWLANMKAGRAKKNK
jgi:hypothetical protein